MKNSCFLITTLIHFLASVCFACSFAPNNSSVEEAYEKLMKDPKNAIANVEILDAKKRSSIAGPSSMMYTFKVIEGFKNTTSHKNITVESGMSSCGYFRPKGTKDFVVMRVHEGKYSIMEQTPYNFEYNKLLEYFRAKNKNPEIKKTKATTKEKFKNKRFKEL